jgi:acetyl-CoA C-acetyltransferase
MSTAEVVLSHPVRTAIGAYNGSLKGVTAPDLGAVVVRETITRSGLDSVRVDNVVLGNVIQAGNRMNPARQAAIHGGLPVSVPAMTVNRVCGSGAQAIWLGQDQLAVAGGMENMDRAPYLMDGGRWGYRMGPAEIHDSMLRDGLDDAFSGKHSGWHTEDLVSKAQISREAQDRFAERSQRRFTDAQKAGHFEAEIVPVTVKGRKGDEIFDHDEAPRPDTTVETLAKLRPAFRPEGSITAGNAPGLNSAASAMLVANHGFAEANGIAPMARLVTFGVAAVEPGMFGLGPISAVRRALERAGWQMGYIRAHRDRRGIRGHPNCRCAGTRAAGGYHQRRRRRHCAWPPHRCYRCHTDDAASAFNAPRRVAPRHRHPLHRGRPGHRPRVGAGLTCHPIAGTDRNAWQC